MANITITIADEPNGSVRVVSTPSNETLLMKIASHGPESLTSAEAYCLMACRVLREESKRQGSAVVLVPRARGL